MALQPDLVHEAEDSSQEDYLLGLNLSNQDSLLIPEAPILTRFVAETGCIDPRLLYKQPSDQVPSPAYDPGDRPIATSVPDGTFAFTGTQTAVESTHWQQPRETGVPVAKPQNGKRQEKREGRSCLECRFRRKKCEHPTGYNAVLLPTNLAAYRMLFIAPDLLMKMTRDLYENVIAFVLDPHSYLRSDDNPVFLHMIMEDPSSLADLRDEHDVVFYPDRLRRMLQMDTYSHSTVMEPAIDVIRFDAFISKTMWPGHEQQPESRFTQAQENILQTARLFCGYVTLLANLDHIEIYTECTEQKQTARLTCVALVYLFIHRLRQLHQELGRNLQALVDRAESNHYVVARTLELIYRCLRDSTPIEWSTTNHPISRQLARICLLLNEQVPQMWRQIESIERNFASPVRGDKRLKKDPTMKAADNLRLPKHLQIYIGGNRLSRSSTNMMLTRNGRINMRTVPVLLSSGDIHDSPPPNLPSRISYQPNLCSANHSLPLHNGEFSSGTAFDAQFQSKTAQTNVATRSSTTIDAEREDGLSSSGLFSWNLAEKHRPWRLEGGTSDEFPSIS